MNSITTDPASIAGKTDANSVTIGNRALRKACFQTILRSDTPFARAVRMKSCCNTSSIPPRICREMNASEAYIKQKTGRIKCEARVRKRSPKEAPSATSPKPIVGNQSSPYSGVVKNISSIVPTQNVGNEYNTKSVTVTARSQPVPLRTAEKTPSGIASR